MRTLLGTFYKRLVAVFVGAAMVCAAVMIPVNAQEEDYSRLFVASGAGIGPFSQAGDIADLSSYGLEYAELMVRNSFLSSGGNGTFSIFAELSDGTAVGVRYTSSNTNNTNAGLTSMTAGTAPAANFRSAGAAITGSSLSSGANITSNFPAVTIKAVSSTSANDYYLNIKIDGTNLTGTFEATGMGKEKSGTPLTFGPVTVPAGTKLKAIKGWTSNANSRTITVPEWQLYDTTIPVAPPAVTNVNASPAADGTVTLSWPSSPGADTYEVSLSGGGAEQTFKIPAAPGSEQQYQITEGLQNGVAHQAGVVSGFRGAFSDNPVIADFTLSLDAVTSLNAAGQPGGAVLSWPAVNGATRYRIERASITDGSAGEFTFVADTANVSFNDAGLNPGLYRWRVTPMNYAGLSEKAPAVTADAEAAVINSAPSGAPESFQVETGISRTAQLSWFPVPLANQYRLSYRTLPAGEWAEPIELGNVFAYKLTGLQNEQDYEFSISAGNSLGWSSETATAEGFVHTTVSPFGLKTNVWFENIHATWNARNNDTGERPFEVYVRPAGTTDWDWVNDPAQPIDATINGKSDWTNDHSPLVRQVIVNGQRVWRVDVPGLAGDKSYDLRITANADGEEEVVRNLTPPPFDRQGFAFHPSSPFGRTTGGYNEDGSFHNKAVVVYVTDENKNSFASPFASGGILGHFGANDRDSTTIAAKNRAGEDTPLGEATPFIVRIVGRVTQPDGMRDVKVDGGATVALSRTANVTIEGIGTDAHQVRWGWFVQNSSNIEVRNLHIEPNGSGNSGGEGGAKDGIFLNGGQQLDAGGAFGNGAGGIVPAVTKASVGDEVKNYMPVNTWLHHNTFTSEGDWDGSMDAARVTFFTISWNHICDNDRGTLIGNNDQNPTFQASIHHNWYDHIHQRHPLLRKGQAHLYNNYIDGESGSGGMSLRDAHAIMEGNYFYQAAEVNERSGGTVIINETTGNEQINALAASLQPNVIIDRSSGGTLPLQHGVGSNFRFFDPRKEDMGVRVDTAEVARERVIAFSGHMRENQDVTPKNEFPVSWQVLGGNGTLTATLSGSAISSGDMVGNGESVLFTAGPDKGYRVKTWRSNGAAVNGANDSLTVDVQEALHITVEFERIEAPDTGIISIQPGNGKITVGLNVPAVSGARLYVGAYQNGKLLNAASLSPINPAGNCDVAMAIPEDADEIRAFVWNDVQGPICPAKAVIKDGTEWKSKMNHSVRDASLITSYHNDQPQMVKVFSVEELTRYIDEYHSGSDLGYFDKNKYDASFFENRFLCFYLAAVTGSSPKFEITELSETTDTIEVEITTPNSYISPDMAAWLLVLEMDRADASRDKDIFVTRVISI